VEARRASRPIFWAEAHSRGRQGDHGRRQLGFGRNGGSGGRLQVAAPDSEIVQRAIAEVPAAGAYADLRPEMARSWNGSSNCFSAIVAQR
jgi:hypothetical protein